jgi:DNA-directed RNA polymerase subunit RPC12/RpoP
MTSTYLVQCGDCGTTLWWTNDTDYVFVICKYCGVRCRPVFAPMLE